VGVLLGGSSGWFHLVRPTIGRVPTQTLWIYESLGLTGFIAIVGIAAGPDFVRGTRASGVSLIIAGIITVLVPHLVGVLVDYYGFKMHPGLLLGVCAGAGTATPARAAVQETARSPVSTVGYEISSAAGTVLLTLWGTVTVVLLG
jgi:putative transport protein